MSDEIIQSDFQACDDLLCSEESRDDFIEANIERLPSWKETAESGDACGQLLYGLCYFYGHGVEESDELAIEWFEKAAEQGNAHAECSLGLCYQNGWGFEEDQRLANEWFEKAATQGHQSAIGNLPKALKVKMGLEPHTILTKTIAEQFVEDQYSLDLSEFTVIEDEAASVLATFTGELDSPEDELLSLDGLSELSESAANALGQFPGSISLDGLTSLGERVAAFLSSSNASLSLKGITFVSDEESKHLSKCKTLNLSGIDSLSDAAAEELGKMEGDHMSLCGLSDVSESAIAHVSKARVETLELFGKTFNLSEKRATHLAGTKAEHLYLGVHSLKESVAKALLQYEGYLYLYGLTGLTDEAAAILAKFSGQLAVGVDHLPDSAIAILKKHPSMAPIVLTKQIAEQFLAEEDSVDLESFDAIEDDAAESLSTYQGDLALNELGSLSENAAEHLSKHQGYLSLNGLDELTDTVADSLSKHQGDVSLLRLTSLSDNAAESLEKHQGELSFTGLTSLSEAAAESLSKHEGRIWLSDLDNLPESAAAILRKRHPFI